MSDANLDGDLQRLFPTVYNQHEHLDEEYQRLMRSELVASRLGALDTVEQTLDAETVTTDELNQWMQAVNVLLAGARDLARRLRGAAAARPRRSPPPRPLPLRRPELRAGQHRRSAPGRLRPAEAQASLAALIRFWMSPLSTLSLVASSSGKSAVNVRAMQDAFGAGTLPWSAEPQIVSRSAGRARASLGLPLIFTSAPAPGSHVVMTKPSPTVSTAASASDGMLSSTAGGSERPW